MRKQLAGIAALLALLVMAGCGDDDEGNGENASSDTPSEDGSSNDDDGQDTSENDEREDAIGEECEEGPGKVVTPIDDLTIPAQHEPDFVVEEQEVAGVTIPEFTVPGIDFPEYTVSGGCIVEFEAPGGCLGQVTITDTGSIPERVIPGYEIPEVRASDGTVLYEGHVQEDIVIEPVFSEGATTEEVCQVVPDDAEAGDTVWGVTRWGITRWGVTQWGATRWGTTVWPICVGGGADEVCSEQIEVPTIDVPTYDIETVDVETKELETYELDDSGTRVIEDEEQTAYLAPADVLFEYDEAELTPEAASTLQTIVDAIQSDFPEGATITVDGHTDNHGEPGYNQRLSEQRAQAVTDWLVRDGSLAQDQITTTGYGEDHPVAPNEKSDGSDNPEGRAMNRRVVITVTAV